MLFGVLFANGRTTQAQERAWEFTLPLQKRPQVVVYQLIQPERLVFEMSAASEVSGYTWPTSWPSWIVRVQRQSYRVGRQEMKRWIFSFRNAFRYQIQQQETWTLRIFPPSMRTLPWLLRYQAERGDLLVATTPHNPSHHLTKQPSHRKTQSEDLRFAQMQKARIQREQEQAQREKERIHREQEQAQREKERIHREEQAQREKERIQREQEQARREKERIQRVHRLLVLSHISNAATFGSLRSFTKADRAIGFTQTKRDLGALALHIERLAVRSVLVGGEDRPHPLGAWDEDAVLHPARLAKRRLQRWLQRRLQHNTFEKQRLYAAIAQRQGSLWAKEAEKMFVPMVVLSQTLWLKQRHLEQPADWASWWESSEVVPVLSLASSAWEPIWKPPVPKTLSVVPSARGYGHATKAADPPVPKAPSVVLSAGDKVQRLRKSPLQKSPFQKSPPFVQAVSPRRAAILGRSSIPKRRPRWKSPPTLIDVLERLVPLKRTAPKNRL